MIITSEISVGDYLIPKAYAYFGAAYRVTGFRRNVSLQLQSGIAEYCGPHVAGNLPGHIRRFVRYCDYYAVNDSEADHFTPVEYSIWLLGDKQ